MLDEQGKSGGKGNTDFQRAISEYMNVMEVKLLISGGEVLE